jgi:hypothetical protein
VPLSEHEQKILDDIERQLHEDDPRFAQSVSNATLSGHLARRIRWAAVGFVVGFAMLMLFWLNIWIALIGFAGMLAAALLIYGWVKQIGADQLRTIQESGRFSLPAMLARLSGRFPNR